MENISKYTMKKNGNIYPVFLTDHVAHTIRNFHTANVVEVVRCKDCKHRVGNSKMCAHPKAIGWDAIEPEDDDFCNYGEKRSEEE